MAESFDNRQFLTGQEADQRSAAGTHIAEVICYFVLLCSGNGIPAADHRVAGCPAQCLKHCL